MIYEAAFIIAGLLLLLVLPPFIVYIFKNRGRQQLDAEVLEMMTRNPNEAAANKNASNNYDVQNPGKPVGSAGQGLSDGTIGVKQFRKTNPKHHFK